MTALRPTFEPPFSCIGLRVRIAIPAVLLTLVTACGGPDLAPWHTERLTSEYDRNNAEEVRTFDDYRKLEDALFEEMRAKVYSEVETGPEYTLVRYSAGSAADPLVRQPNWNYSFEMPAEDPAGAVLLLHGMSDSPYTYRALGTALAENGYWVVGLRLPGHGTAPSGLRHVTWQDMAAAVDLTVDHLASKVGDRPVHIVGYSTGAALALNFTLDALDGDSAPVPASLVLISPAIGVHSATALASWSDRVSRVPGLAGLSWAQIQPEFDPYKYNSFAMNGGTQVHNVTRAVARRIRERSESESIGDFPPVLVFKSTVDATVTNEALVSRLLGLLPPNRNELVLFDINRSAIRSRIMIEDPGPFTERLMNDVTLPFAIELITNESPESEMVISRRKLPYSGVAAGDHALNMAWPPGVISLSHVALPFPPDDPLYGRGPPSSDEVLFLGQMAIQGERGLLTIPADWMLRLRHNPFYKFLESRTLRWFDELESKQ